MCWRQDFHPTGKNNSPIFKSIVHVHRWGLQRSPKYSEYKKKKHPQPQPPLSAFQEYTCSKKANGWSRYLRSCSFNIRNYFKPCLHNAAAELLHVNKSTVPKTIDGSWEYLHTIRPIIDYRYEDDRFLVSPSCVTCANPNLLPSSETEVNPGIRSWRMHLSEWALCQKAIEGIYSKK
jgi:hypothetical protein